LILGHGRHGKDTVAEMLRDHIGLTFRSSSEAACEIAVFPRLSQMYGYETPAECFADRANHRQEWRDLIIQHNTPDLGRLCKDILATHDCYVGMRNKDEYEATKHLFDVVIWVDAHRRCGADFSMDVPFDKTMAYVDNNGDVASLGAQMKMLSSILSAMQARAA
jgi:hypothetical protein